MSSFYFHALLWRFLLLVTAFINAAIRELTYKPLLTPLIWQRAHELSAITGIVFFTIVIYRYIKKNYSHLTQKKAYFIWFLWMLMTICFESGMGLAQGKNFWDIFSSYVFWNGNMWFFVVVSLLFLPGIIYYFLTKKSQ
jgi:hypothetical protein